MVKNKYTRENAIKILLEAGVTEEWANEYLDRVPNLTDDKILGICGNPDGVKKIAEYRGELDSCDLSCLILD